MLKDHDEVQEVSRLERKEFWREGLHTLRGCLVLMLWCSTLVFLVIEQDMHKFEVTGRLVSYCLFWGGALGLATYVFIEKWFK